MPDLELDDGAVVDVVEEDEVDSGDDGDGGTVSRRMTMCF